MQQLSVPFSGDRPVAGDESLAELSIHVVRLTGEPWLVLPPIVPVASIPALIIEVEISSRFAMPNTDLMTSTPAAAQNRDDKLMINGRFGTTEALPIFPERASDLLLLLVAGTGFEPVTFGS